MESGLLSSTAQLHPSVSDSAHPHLSYSVSHYVCESPYIESSLPLHNKAPTLPVPHCETLALEGRR